MKKEIFHSKTFSFFLKKDSELSEEEKNEMHDHLVVLYPPFKALYDKNRYYSTTKPQMTFLVKEAGRIVGSGKLLWRNVKVGNEKIKLFGFGMLIDEPYQKQGIGTNISIITKQEAKKKGADLLYASSNNPNVEKMLAKLGFEKLKTPVMYKDSLTKEIKRESNFVYVFEFKKGLIKKINKLEHLYIGNQI